MAATSDTVYGPKPSQGPPLSPTLRGPTRGRAKLRTGSYALSKLLARGSRGALSFRAVKGGATQATGPEPSPKACKSSRPNGLAGRL